MNITSEQFSLLFPNNKEASAWTDALNSILPQYNINTIHRVAGFLAQCGHESNGFTVLSENLNYGAAGLKTVFGKYFKTTDPLQYERKPEKIANHVYCNRMGNGDEASGDGWKYRGRGPIQITGKNNYTSFSADMGIDVMASPDMVSMNKRIALLSAVWFWNKNDLNTIADNNDIKGMTQRINGGVNGLAERTKLYNKALGILNT
jgi:putative chitinase